MLPPPPVPPASELTAQPYTGAVGPSGGWMAVCAWRVGAVQYGTTALRNTPARQSCAAPRNVPHAPPHQSSPPAAAVPDPVSSLRAIA